MNRKIFSLIVVLIIAAEYTTCLAEQQKPLKKYRGWWWKEMPVEEPESEEQKETKAQPQAPVLKDYTYEQLWNMHPDKFQPILISIQKKAVQTLAEKDVRDYYAIQDIARRKSAAFSNASSYIMQKYPELSVAADYPVNAPGRNVLVKQRSEEIGDLIRSSVNDFALVYFYSPDCRACYAQNNILKFFEEKYFFPIKEININIDPDSAARFNVTRVPFLMLVYKDSDSHMPISSGVTALSRIELNMYRSIRLLKGDITPSGYALYDFQKGGSFDVEAPLKANRIKTE